MGHAKPRQYPCFLCSRHAKRAEIVRSDNSSATLSPDVVDARLNGHAGFHQGGNNSVKRSHHLLCFAGGRRGRNSRTKEKPIDKCETFSICLPRCCQPDGSTTSRAVRRIAPERAEGLALIVCYDIIIVHGGVFLLLLAPISQHSFEHRVEHIAFVPSSSPSVVTQPATRKFDPFRFLGRPSLLGTREREDP
jgi:hypothetical protein